MVFRSDATNSEVDRDYYRFATDEEWSTYFVATARDAQHPSRDLLCVMQWDEANNRLRDVISPIYNDNYYEVNEITHMSFNLESLTVIRAGD
jgi:hypothetical protein